MTLAALILVTVLRCYDGDTCRVMLPQATESTPVRLAGIDAPEIHARCPLEHTRAIAARDRLRALVYPPAHVQLQITGQDRKWHRVVGRLIVSGPAGPRDAGAVLLDEGLARPYDGGTRKGWC